MHLKMAEQEQCCPVKPGLLVLSQPAIRLQAHEVSRAETNAENGMVPEAPAGTFSVRR